MYNTAQYLYVLLWCFWAGMLCSHALFFLRLHKLNIIYCFLFFIFAVCVLIRAFRPDLWTRECRLQTSVRTRYYGISSGKRKLPLRKSDTDLFYSFAKQRVSLYSSLYSRDMFELPSPAPNRGSLLVWLLATSLFFNNQRLGNCEAR